MDQLPTCKFVKYRAKICQHQRRDSLLVATAMHAHSTALVSTTHNQGLLIAHAYGTLVYVRTLMHTYISLHLVWSASFSFWMHVQLEACCHFNIIVCAKTTCIQSTICCLDTLLSASLTIWLPTLTCTHYADDRHTCKPIDIHCCKLL